MRSRRAGRSARTSNGAPGVRRAAHDRHPATQGHRQRLAAERARVHDRLVADHRPVDRNDLTGPDQHGVAGRDAVDRDLLQRPVDTKLRDPRRARHQPRELAAGATGRGRLERRPAGEHQADDGAGKLLAERQRADHRHQGDRVDTQVVIDDHRAARPRTQAQPQAAPRHRATPDDRHHPRRRDAARSRQRSRGPRSSRGPGRATRPACAARAAHGHRAGRQAQRPMRSTSSLVQDDRATPWDHPYRTTVASWELRITVAPGGA